MSTGLVSLVGAGPGDPDLLTRRAAARLADADVVFFDALVSPEVLALAPRARRFPVGKRAGRPSLDQAAINRLLVRAARRGRRVVRLKGGDPFVLGRGGEEALALASAGVPFEIVPGVTSAVAAPALAGIPLTHRGVSSAFLVVSGHDEAAYRPALGSLAPGAATVVVLMGVRMRAAIAAFLQVRGWDAATPAAIAFDAGRATASAWIGTLGDLGRGEPADLPGGAGTIVIGAVVALSRVIAGAADDAAGESPRDEMAEADVSVRFPLHRFGW